MSCCGYIYIMKYNLTPWGPITPPISFIFCTKPLETGPSPLLLKIRQNYQFPTMGVWVVSYIQNLSLMQQVTRRSEKTVEQYRHNIKLLKYHLKREQKINETLRYKDAKKNKKELLAKNTPIKERHPLYAMITTVAGLSVKVKELGLALGDVFRMADSSYRGEVTREQFMTTVSKLKANLQQTQINEMFYAIDSNLNGMLSSDQYEQFLFAHGGTENKPALAYQRDSAQKFLALLKKKNMKVQDMIGKMLNPIPLADINAELKKIGLNGNQCMMLFKMWDPSLTGLIKHQTVIKSMQNFKMKDQRQIQNQKFEKGVKELCVLFRDRKINPIEIFQISDVDGKEGVTSFQLEEGFKQLFPEETPYQIKKWVNLININGDSEISRQEFVSAIRSFYSLQKIQNFSSQYEKLHPKLKKALAQEDFPADKTINQLSIYIEDNGLTKKEVFYRIDVNHNGLIDKEELFEGLKALGVSVGLIGRVLAVFDRDASGEIGLEEWLSILGEDLEMEDVEIPSEEKVEKVKGESTKTANDLKKKEDKKQVKQQSSKPKQPSKTVKQGTKKTVIEQKSSKKVNEVPIVKKPKVQQQQSQKKPLKDHDKNKVVASKTGQKLVSQSKNQAKISIKQSKKQPPSKRFADQQQYNNQTEELKQTFSEQQLSTQQLQRQIAQIYSKAPKKTKQIFTKCSKNGKKGLSERQLAQFIKEMKVKAPYDERYVKKIFEESCSNNGLITVEWFDKLSQNFELNPKEEAQSSAAKQQIKSSKSKNDNTVTLSGNAITSKIPKVLEEKIQQPQQEEYGNQQFEENEASKSNLKKDQKGHVLRGKDNENFQQLQENHDLQPQTISDEGYKLKKLISCEDQIALLQGKYATTANSLKKNKKTFQDKSFPAALASLTHLPPNQSQISQVTLIKWKHYKQLYKTPQLFKDNISPNDIKQGTLGDCYFLCSLAALAQYKNLIQRLFEYFDMENGYFLIWVCIDGQWRLVQLDGYVPVSPTGDRPAFSHGEDGELWVMLLQKAYAKAYGNYQKINGGQPYEAIKDLTGAPGQSFCHRREEVKAEELWKKLENANKQQFIMTCGTDADSTGTIQMEGHSESVTNEGLVLGHAYSILDVREYRGQKLIQLRNPWGETEWKGDWSDQSKKWTQNAKKQLGYTSLAEDGIFWMPFEAYFSKYNTTAINYLRPNYHYTSHPMKGVKSLVVKISENSFRHGFVMVTQEDHRKEGLPVNTPYNMCHIIALEYRKGKLFREISNEKYLYQRQGSAEISSATDSRIAILINLEKKTDVSLCSYADSKIEWEVDDSSDGMMQCVQDLATMQSRAKNVQQTPNMFKTWMTSVGEHGFMVFKSVAKKAVRFTVGMPSPKNLELLGKQKKKEIELAPGETKCIRGRILSLKDPYSFGPMDFSIDEV